MATGRNACRGLTLIELLLALLILSLLASLALPVVTGGIHRAKESALKEDLYTVRRAIDDYYADTGNYPAAMEELVRKRYLRRIPADPFTGSGETWHLVRTDETDDDRNGIIDIRSGSDAVDEEGTPYSRW